MQIDGSRRHQLAGAAAVAIMGGLVAGCVGQSQPAPVYLRGAGQPVFAPMPAQPPALQVLVKRGQTLDGYAYTYHLPKSAIIAANGLRSPYKLEAGQHLIIPNRGVQQAMTPVPASAAPPWSPPSTVSGLPQQEAAIAQPPRPEAIAMSAPASHPPQTILPEPSAATPVQPPPAQPTPVHTAAPPQSPAPPSAAAQAGPEIIQLAGSPPAKQAQAAPPKLAATLTPSQPPAPAQAVVPLNSPPPAATLPTAQAEAVSPSGGRFPWPVRGRILGAYGNSPGGGHNDGINIGAPLGTPVRAIDGGTVVYSGNEVKGYGNIVLIRHANGWISAYAHLEDVSVKQGEAISPGEVIAKVGNSGGVNEPQLHFELRRGKKPVNPTEFLAPAPSAEGKGDRAG
jgi:murein DD-endopeptidase MepM/ murein hydrolase activator NlpD